MKKEWAFPNSIPIDISFNDGYDALNLPEGKFDYIFSSHCLEHTINWIDVMNYWYFKLEYTGVLFLYLPHPDQKYWLPWNNRKHNHVLHPKDIKRYMIDKGYKNVFCSKIDLNYSYIIMGEK